MSINLILEEPLADPAGAFARLYQFLALPAAAGLPARLAADPDDAPGRRRRFRTLLAPHRSRLAPWVAALGLAD